MWFTVTTAGWVGGILGTLIGIWGAIIGICDSTLVDKGKARGFVLRSMLISIAVGCCLLITGIIALLLGQPTHVWNIFILPGGLTTALFGLLYPSVKKRYQKVEERKIDVINMTD